MAIQTDDFAAREVDWLLGLGGISRPQAITVNGRGLSLSSHLVRGAEYPASDTMNLRLTFKHLQEVLEPARDAEVSAAADIGPG